MDTVTLDSTHAKEVLAMHLSIPPIVETVYHNDDYPGTYHLHGYTRPHKIPLHWQYRFNKLGLTDITIGSCFIGLYKGHRVHSIVGLDSKDKKDMADLYEPINTVSEKAIEKYKKDSNLYLLDGYTNKKPPLIKRYAKNFIKNLKYILLAGLVLLTLTSILLFSIEVSKNYVKVTGVITDKFGEAVSGYKSREVYNDYIFVIRMDDGRYIDTKITPSTFSQFKKGDRIEVEIYRGKIEENYDLKAKILMLIAILSIAILMIIGLHKALS